MKNLDEYIKQNGDKFNDGELPGGHMERFGQRLQQGRADNETHRKPRHKAIRMVWKIALPIAAVIVAGLLLRISLEQKAEPGTDYAALLAQQKKEVLELINLSTDPYLSEQMAYALDNVLFEAIPMDESLPKGLPSYRREKILQDHYNIKTEGIARIKHKLKNQ